MKEREREGKGRDKKGKEEDMKGKEKKYEMGGKADGIQRRKGEKKRSRGSCRGRG